MDAWEFFVLVFASYVAIMSLVRLMRQRRDALIADMRQQIDADRQRREAEERRKKRAAKREKRKAA